MRIERAVNYLRSLGPGSRLCVWLNGCNRRCPGCVSARLQEVDERTEVDVYEYFFPYNLENTDGVTISGGEPFMQAKELCVLVEYFRMRGVKDILVYTGYTLEELKDMKDPAVDKVLREISVLIDGPYVESLDDGIGNLKGSSNQRIIYIDESQKSKYEEYLRQERAPEEMILGNTALSVGIPSREYVEKFNGK